MAHHLPDGRTVAIAHDYVTQRGGAERVVLAMARAFPGAPVYTTLYDPVGSYPEFRGLDMRTSSIDRVAGFRRNHRSALPVLPRAARSVRSTEDVVIASTSGWAHGFAADGDVIAYCHAPARWLYQSETYVGGPLWARPSGIALWALRPSLHRWDRDASRRPTRYLCNSRVVRDRIRTAYGIDATVLPAPHAMDAGAPREPVPAIADWAGEGYLLVVSRLLPYKNVDAVVEAVRGTDLRLVVVGSGPGRRRLASLLPRNVRLVGGLSDAQLRWTYAHARLLVAPSFEDYGLSPLEAAAFGVPSLTLGAGGYLDTVVAGVTGRFVERPDPGLLRAGARAALAQDLDPDVIRAHAAEFSETRFHERLRSELGVVGALR